MEAPPWEIVGDVRVLPAGRSAKAISRHLTKSYLVKSFKHSCPGPCAVTFLHHVPRRRVQKLEQGSHLTHGVARTIGARELYAPISCILLVMHYQMFQECCPIVQVLDNRRELAVGTPTPLSQQVSQGEPRNRSSACNPPKGWIFGSQMSA